VRSTTGRNNSTRERSITTLKETQRTNKVLIVADNVSARFGGEAFLPLHYFEVLRERGVDTHLLTHIRRRDEICELFPDELERIHYVADRPIQQRIWKLSGHMPTVVHEFTLAAVSNFIQQHDMRSEAKRLVKQLGITVVDNVVLDILGDGQERASLETKAAVLGLKNVSFVGFVPQELAAVYLETVDTLVLPSLYECGGAVVLEAMAKSLPVIATRWGGPADCQRQCARRAISSR
jgi:glycosyltransferase involved in cell wall biosynthesis